MPPGQSRQGPKTASKAGAARRFNLKKQCRSLNSDAIAASLRKKFEEQIPEAMVMVLPPPPVRGVGRAGGFKIMIEDRSSSAGSLEGLRELEKVTNNLVDAAEFEIDPATGSRRSGPSSPTHVVGLSRQRAAGLRRPEPQLGDDQGRPAAGRLPDVADLPGLALCQRLQSVRPDLAGDRPVRGQVPRPGRRHQAAEGPQSSTARWCRWDRWPTCARPTVRSCLTRYNMYPAAFINGAGAQGTSSRQAIDLMDQLAAESLPPSMATEWTEMAYLELLAGNTAMIVFAFAVVMVFLVLAAQYESWSLPLAVILVVPMCLLSAITGVWIANMDINIFTQIGFVVLVGLASKNAILIVEFAKVHREKGLPVREATLEACRLRLRPIVMTSIAFILGVVPLLLSSRRRRRDEAHAGHRRFQRHARRDRVRDLLDARVLLRGRKIERGAPVPLGTAARGQRLRAGDSELAGALIRATTRPRPADDRPSRAETSDAPSKSGEPIRALSEGPVFSQFFIDRPIFASVLSIVITLAGFLAVFTLPVAQYPEITPPTVEVSAFYPGANAKVVADTVAAPIEQQVNGVENMLYMSSQCTNDGTYTLTVTFKLGVDLNMAQVLVQNRESLADPILPDLVKRRGVAVKKKSPSILMIINLFSPDKSRDNLYMSNYATIQLSDELARLPGVGDITYIGQRDYSMRIWVDPQKMAFRSLTAADVVVGDQRAERPGRGRPARPAAGRHRPGLSVHDQHAGPAGRRQPVRRHDHQDRRSGADRPAERRGHGRAGRSRVRPELHAGRPAVGRAFGLSAARLQRARDRQRGPRQDGRAQGPLSHRVSIIRSSTTRRRSSRSRSTRCSTPCATPSSWSRSSSSCSCKTGGRRLIPLVAVPVAIVGTFAVMAAIGFSLNNLTLFGLVLAIGIVVDDAIVVVEAVEHHIEHGLAPREATITAMSQVSSPVIAVGLVLTAVFVPCAFITGITGQFYRQFALTIATSTIISAFNSLTLSPALSALLLQPRQKGSYEALPWFAFVGLGMLARLYASWARHAEHWIAGPACRSGLPSRSAPVRRHRGWRLLAGRPGRAGSSSFPLNRILGWCFYRLQQGLRRGDQRLHPHRRRAVAGQRAGPGALRRPARADLLELHAHAHRLHPLARQGLSALERPVARLVVARADAGGHEADRADRGQDARSRPHRGDRRSVDPLERQRPQLRRDVRDARRFPPSRRSTGSPAR